MRALLRNPGNSASQKGQNLGIGLYTISHDIHFYDEYDHCNENRRSLWSYSFLLRALTLWRFLGIHVDMKKAFLGHLFVRRILSVKIEERVFEFELR